MDLISYVGSKRLDPRVGLDAGSEEQVTINEQDEAGLEQLCSNLLYEAGDDFYDYDPFSKNYGTPEPVQSIETPAPAEPVHNGRAAGDNGDLKQRFPCYGWGPMQKDPNLKCQWIDAQSSDMYKKIMLLSSTEARLSETSRIKPNMFSLKLCLLCFIICLCEIELDVLHSFAPTDLVLKKITCMIYLFFR